MPMTYEQHEKSLKSPAVCELLPLRDLPAGTVVHVAFRRGAARRTADIRLRDLTNER